MVSAWALLPVLVLGIIVGRSRRAMRAIGQAHAASHAVATANVDVDQTVNVMASGLVDGEGVFMVERRDASGRFVLSVAPDGVRGELGEAEAVIVGPLQRDPGRVDA